METSPVGVVVFEGGTGKPVSFNREARRIAEGLRLPGRPLEELLNVVTCRWADGREVTLAEFPMAQQVSTSETVRTEELTLSVPDGPNVTVLVNATPIRSASGAVESMVVTLQGSGAPGGTGSAAGRVPEHGEPRTEDAVRSRPRREGTPWKSTCRRTCRG